MSDDQKTDVPDSERFKIYQEKALKFMDTWEKTGVEFREAFAKNPDSYSPSLTVAMREWESFIRRINSEATLICLAASVESLEEEVARLRVDLAPPYRHTEGSMR